MENQRRVRWAVARVLKEARGEAGNITQNQLGGLAGFSEGIIPRAEQARNNLTIFDLTQIAAVLKISAAELMRRIEEEMQNGPRKPATPLGRPRKKVKKPRRRAR